MSHFIERVPTTPDSLPCLEFTGCQNGEIADREIPLQESPSFSHSLVEVERIAAVEYDGHVEIA